MADKLSNSLGINAGGNDLGNDQQGTQGGGAAKLLYESPRGLPVELKLVCVS